MNMKKKNVILQIILLLLVVITSTEIYSQGFRIVLDEDYTDWKSLLPLYADDTGDGSGIDFKMVKVTNYNGYLFLYLELGSEINLQDNNNVTLYLDTDNDSATGLQLKGIGAELEYTFGTRSGKFRDGLLTIDVSHADIGFVSIPTVTSSVFEIMIDTTSVIAGKKLFSGSEIKIALVNDITGGDEIPNGNVEPIFVFTSTESQMEINYSIEKLNNEWVRILSYNSERDNLFDPSLKDSYSRIFKALDPTIIGFQEIYNHTADQTATLIEEFLPSSEGEQWYSEKQGSDIIVISRFPIDQSFYVEGNGAFLINLRDQYGKDLLFVNAHTPCCDNNDSRQEEIDAFMAFIRDAKNEGGILSLEDKTPIVIVGDMNLVGYKQQQTTLTTGDIVNTNIFGEKFIPDWDSTDLKDSKPPTTNMPATLTWYNEGSAFAPGRLDYIVFTNSVIELKNNFILFTNELPQDSLDKYNLVFDDVTRASDHLPTVVDFDFNYVVSVEEISDEQRPNDFKLSQNYPNPFNPSTTIKYSIPFVEKHDHVTLQLVVYDILGREVAILVNQEQKSGNYEVHFDASNLTSGIYFYQIRADDILSNTGQIYTETKMMLLLK